MTPSTMTDKQLTDMQRAMVIRGFGIRDAILTAEIRRRNATRPADQQMKVYQ